MLCAQHLDPYFVTRLYRYHEVWLEAHPYVDAEWLRAKLKDGFHVHHCDGDRNNDNPDNLLLIFGPDHSRLHRLERRIDSLERVLGTA